jgi:hypothetical protein
MKFPYNLVDQVTNLQHLVNINLELNSKTLVRGSKHPTFATTLRNTIIKKNQLLVFMLVIEVMDKHSRILVDTMDQINIVELDIDNNQTKFQEKTFKLHLKHLKERDGKAYKMNQNVVSVLSYLNFSFCHAFIKDQQLLPLEDISNSSFEE